MAEIVTTVCFTGLNGAGAIQLVTDGAVKAGHRIAGVGNLTSNNGSNSSWFGQFIPADDIILQTSSSDLSGQRFVALIVEDYEGI